MRKVHILMTVTMGGEDGKLDRGYYEDRELDGLLRDWIAGEITMHDDSPCITHWSATVVTTNDARSRKLAALEAAGVDNWDGYDEAIQSLEGA